MQIEIDRDYIVNKYLVEQQLNQLTNAINNLPAYTSHEPGEFYLSSCLDRNTFNLCKDVSKLIDHLDTLITDSYNFSLKKYLKQYGGLNDDSDK